MKGDVRRHIPYLLLFYKRRKMKITIVDGIWMFLLCLVSYFDGRKKKIPKELQIGVALCAGIHLLVEGRTHILEYICGGIVVFLVYFLILMIAPGSFGGGDVKLSISNGVYLGTVPWLKSFAIAIVLAASVIVCKVCFGQKMRGEEISFGPFLCIGAITSYIISMPFLINSYM